MAVKRTAVAKVIKVISAIAALVVAWQAVRFCTGDIGNIAQPVFSLLRAALGMAPLEPNNVWSLASAGILSLFEALFGFVIWLMLASVITVSGLEIARIVEVGWPKYQEEQREAKRIAERNSAEARRRELRQKAMELRAPKRSSGGFSFFFLGLLTGALLF